ncbi:hypothetical protein GCM10025868_21890 [Angustibacter aerolatus]|uniref:Glycosyltransferase 2-like domain-containing protein n=1 Tax=Angustibacter aerolatus TaxID=1162965 RepID=A0ABQ6JGM3_9ACTN|nr:hypothetical protein GCM10025868_21890 [Angustibacter aerolatus]
MAVVVPAKDEADRVAATVEAVRSLAVVDLVVVVDDGAPTTPRGSPARPVPTSSGTSATGARVRP